MRKFFFFLFVLLIVFPFLTQGFLERKAVKIGEQVPDFELSDTAGNAIRLSSFHGKIVMSHFWSATCPFVKRYEERIQQITRDYADRGIAVLGIDSNDNETLEQIKKVALEHNVNYPIAMDPGNKVADQFGAVTTPHVFVIDQGGVLRYEGSVDDQGWSEQNPVTKSYAREAIEAVLAGSTVPNPQTKTFGCTIKRRL